MFLGDQQQNNYKLQLQVVQYIFTVKKTNL